MDTFHGRAALRSAPWKIHALALAIALTALSAGCKTDPTNPFLAHEHAGPRAGSALEKGDPVATEPVDPGVLGEANWFEQPPPSYANRADTDRRWHHPRLEGHLSASSPQSDLSEALASTNPIVATNAAILVAHWGAGQPTEHLAAAIRADRLPLPLRCAAAEALGHLEQPAPVLNELLGELVPLESRQPEDGQVPLRREVPDLHADLIRALARHAQPGDEKWFNAALVNRAWQVRLEGIAAWGALADLTLPENAIELRRDGDPRVRATALHTIAAHRDPRAVSYLQQALDDGDFDVRVAAVNGLRDIGSADAKALLGSLKNRGAELKQAAVAAGDAAEKMRGDVQAAAVDARSQLRTAVTETLDNAEQRGQELAAETTAAAQQTVRQASAQVEDTLEGARAATESVAARVGEAQQLVDSLRKADLPDAARRQASTALERMAMDAQLEVRVQAARAMGEVADPSFLPVLMALLSDEGEVQTAAMTSLSQIAGTDVTAAADAGPQTTDDKIRTWQLWYRDRQSAPTR
jgi:HEAT repeat protein